jgi:hypothetical protein
VTVAERGKGLESLGRNSLCLPLTVVSLEILIPARCSKIWPMKKVEVNDADGMFTVVPEKETPRPPDSE